MRIKPDYNIAMAAGFDAANRNMKANHRKAWSVEDWNAMCDTFDKIMLIVDSPKPGRSP